MFFRVPSAWTTYCLAMSVSLSVCPRFSLETELRTRKLEFGMVIMPTKWERYF